MSNQARDDSRDENTVIFCKEKKEQMVPKFLPCDELLGWSFTKGKNQEKRDVFSYTVTCQLKSENAPSEDSIPTIEYKCDGPCRALMPTRKMIRMGKCDHLLCKACFGIVLNPDGSYGCSNFDCWSEPSKSFQHEKKKYRKVLNNQIHRAHLLKKYGDDVISCSEKSLPQTPIR